MAKKQKIDPQMQRLQTRFKQAQQEYLTGYQSAMGQYQDQLADYSQRAGQYEANISDYLNRSQQYSDYLSSFYITDPKRGPETVVRDGGTFKAKADGGGYYDVPSGSYQFVRTGTLPVTRRNVRYITYYDPQFRINRTRAEYYYSTTNYETGYLRTAKDGQFTTMSPYEFPQRQLPTAPSEEAPPPPEMADTSALRQRLAQEEQYFKREASERTLAAKRARTRRQERPLLSGEGNE